MVLSDWLSQCLEELLLIPELDQPSTVHQYLQKEQQIQHSRKRIHLLLPTSHFKNTIQILPLDPLSKVSSSVHSEIEIEMVNKHFYLEWWILQIPTTARDSRISPVPRTSPVPRIPTNPPSTRMRKRKYECSGFEVCRKKWWCFCYHCQRRFVGWIWKQSFYIWQ
jgi:hypothetical protein